MKTLSTSLHDRRPAIIAISVAVLFIGFLAGLPNGSPPPVLAACQVPNSSCGSDGTKTAAIDVRHIETNGTTWVSPGTESWLVTVTWNAANGLCVGYQETVTTDVSWNGLAWVLANTNFNGTNIIAINVCDISGSCASSTGPMAYKLIVDINDPIPGGPAYPNLQSVTFATTAVGNGVEYNMLTCATNGTNKTPSSQSFSATDNGNFECGYSCVVTGTSVDITY